MEAKESTAVEDGFVAIHLSDMQRFPADAAGWSETGGVISTTGSPKGYVYTSSSYDDFEVRVDVRFMEEDGTPGPADANTGLMLLINEPHRTWPNSLEVQGKWSEMARPKANGRETEQPEVHFDVSARDETRLSPREWNRIVATCRDGALEVSLNGRPVGSSTTVASGTDPSPLRSGAIGLQAEGYRVQFRHFAVRPLSVSGSEAERRAGEPSAVP